MSIPKYLKIFYELKNNINRELLTPGNALPSENELSKIYQASRMTVRRSLSLLKDYGYIDAYPGKGYFIRKPEQNKYILHFNEMDLTGVAKENTRLLEVNIVPPGKKIMEGLLVPANAKIIMIKRLLYTSREPVSYDIKYLLYDRGKPIVEKEIHYATFPELIARYTSLFSIRKELSIMCRPADAKLSELLQVKVGFPLAVIEQKLINDQQKPLGMGTTYINSEYFQLKAFYTTEHKLTTM